MPPKKNNRKGAGNQPAPQPVQADSLGEHFSHAEFRAVFTTLANFVEAQNERPAVVPANSVANTAATRIRDFTQMNPLSFTRSKSEEDPQKFLDMVQKVTDVMG